MAKPSGSGRAKTTTEVTGAALGDDAAADHRVSANLDDRFRNRPQSAPDSTASNPTRRGATRRYWFGISR
jgi:hypothetical protein